MIDDGSTDGTAAVAAALIAEIAATAGEPRLTLLAAGPLPAGWRGKVHALWVGAQGVATPWLLLTDADARHHPELLARALAAAAAGGLDAVSVAGWQEARGMGENLIVPPVFALLDAVLGDWRAAAAGGGPPVASGQFLLVRREAWDAAGGFPTIRGAPIDDVALAVRLRAHGGRTAFFRAPDLLRVRMYRGGGAAVQGWRRNLGAIFGPRPAAAAAPLAFLLLPPLALLAALATGRWVEAALLWGAGVAASGLCRAGSGHPPGWALLYPLDALALAALLAAGVRDHRRGRLASWKGREIPV